LAQKLELLLIPGPRLGETPKVLPRIVT
jgi:hypothetical protein